MLGKLSYGSDSRHCADIFMEKQTLGYVLIFTLPYRNVGRKSLIISPRRILSCLHCGRYYWKD